MKARKRFQQGSILAALGLGLVASSAYATELCHNIGGPQDLGANCDGTGNCSFVVGGLTITVPPGFFLGIKIGGPQFQAPVDLANNAVAAHIAHGDGITLLSFDPPLHLASSIGPHRASNVECFAERIITQPPDPGN
jgi:hypothetical protein